MGVVNYSLGTAETPAPPTATPPDQIIPGGGVCNTIAVNPSGTVALTGSDLWGVYRWETNAVGNPVWKPSLGFVESFHRPASVFWLDDMTAVALCGHLGAGGGVFRSDDAGVSFSLVSTAVQGAGGNSREQTTYQGVQSTWMRYVGDLFAYDGTRLYVGGFGTTAGTGGVWRSTDNGDTWTQIALDGEPIKAVALDPNTANRLLVATHHAGLQRIDNAHATPTVTQLVDGVKLTSNTIIETVAFHSSGRAYIATVQDDPGADTGYAGGHILEATTLDPISVNRITANLKATFPSAYTVSRWGALSVRGDTLAAVTYDLVSGAATSKAPVLARIDVATPLGEDPPVGGAGWERLTDQTADFDQNDYGNGLRSWYGYVGRGANPIGGNSHVAGQVTQLADGTIAWAGVAGVYIRPEATGIVQPFHYGLGVTVMTSLDFGTNPGQLHAGNTDWIYMRQDGDGARWIDGTYVKEPPYRNFGEQTVGRDVDLDPYSGLVLAGAGNRDDHTDHGQVWEFAQDHAFPDDDIANDGDIDTVGQSTWDTAASGHEATAILGIKPADFEAVQDRWGRAAFADGVGLLRWDPGTPTWSLVEPITTTSPAHAIQLERDIVEPDTLWCHHGKLGTWRSTDTGVNWSKISNLVGASGAGRGFVKTAADGTTYLSLTDTLYRVDGVDARNAANASIDDDVVDITGPITRPGAICVERGTERLWCVQRPNLSTAALLWYSDNQGGTWTQHLTAKHVPRGVRAIEARAGKLYLQTDGHGLWVVPIPTDAPLSGILVADVTSYAYCWGVLLGYAYGDGNFNVPTHVSIRTRHVKLSNELIRCARMVGVYAESGNTDGTIRRVWQQPTHPTPWTVESDWWVRLSFAELANNAAHYYDTVPENDAARTWDLDRLGWQGRIGFAQGVIYGEGHKADRIFMDDFDVPRTDSALAFLSTLGFAGSYINTLSGGLREVRFDAAETWRLHELPWARENRVPA